MSLPVLTVSVRPDDVGLVEEACTAVAGCGSPDLASVVFLVVVAAFLAFFLAAALTHVREARSLVAEERDRAAAERDAFLEFADRIADIDATPTASVEAPGGVAALAAQPADRRLERIREAYRETVMAVPHYEAEYAEPIEANMAAELGDEVAAAVTGGSGLTPQVKQTLLEGSREASRRREELIADLEHEAESLTDADETLKEVDRSLEAYSKPSLHRWPFDDLVEHWDRLAEFEERCRDLVDERQKELHDPPKSARFDAPTLQEYLYDGLDTTHPVVTDATAVLERIRRIRRDVTDAITRRA